MNKTNDKNETIYVNVSPKGEKDYTVAANVLKENEDENEKSFFQRALETLRERVFRYGQKKKGPHQAYFPSFPNIKKVFILFESDLLERNSQLKQLVRELQADGKTVTAWGFVDKKQITSAILRDYRVLGTQDFDFFGRPKEQHRKDLNLEHFDLLINLDVNHLTPLRYLNLYANADFRVGMVTEEPYENDFMVAIPDDQRNLVYLFDQIMLYIRKINAASTYQTMQAQPANKK